jgi:hypothetical protein
MSEGISIEKKRKKLTSNSVGNRHKFNQQKQKKPKDNFSELSARENLRDVGIINDLDSLSHCCLISGDWGCCLKHFIDKDIDIPDFEKALKYVKENRIASKESCSNEIRTPWLSVYLKAVVLRVIHYVAEREFSKWTIGCHRQLVFLGEIMPLNAVGKQYGLYMESLSMSGEWRLPD